MKRFLSLTLALALALAGSLALAEDGGVLGENEYWGCIMFGELGMPGAEDPEWAEDGRDYVTLSVPSQEISTWACLPEGSEPSQTYRGMGARLTISPEQVDGWKKGDLPILMLDAIEIVGSLYYGTLTAFGDDFADVRNYYEDGAPLAGPPTITLTLTPDTEINHPLVEGSTFEFVYTEDNQVLMVYQANG